MQPRRPIASVIAFALITAVASALAGCVALPPAVQSPGVQSPAAGVHSESPPATGQAPLHAPAAPSPATPSSTAPSSTAPSPATPSSAPAPPASSAASAESDAE